MKLIFKKSILFFAFLLVIFPGYAFLDERRIIITQTTGGGVDENFYMNIEDNYNPDVRFNISAYSQPDYRFKVRHGRHFVITGDVI